MARVEAIHFQGCESVKVDLSYGNPPKVEEIIFSRRLERSTPAATISGIFWEEPSSLQDIVRDVQEFSRNNLLDLRRSRLLRVVAGRIDRFIKATRFYPPED